MSRTNKEQILFILVLVVLGAMGYFRYNDQAKRTRVPPSKTYEWERLADCPEIQFLGDADGRYAATGRNIFLPPRDWFALRPLRLDTPPGVDLDPVWPFTRPALSEEFFGRYTFPLALATAPAGEAPGTEPESVDDGALADGGALGGDEPGAIDIDLDEVELEDPDAALMKRFDWIRLKDRQQRIFGQILNPDKFALLEAVNKDPITLRRYVQRNDKWAETFDYERAKIGEFAFAQTVANLYHLKKRDIIPNAANITRMHELATWCIDRRDEDPQAIGFAVEMARMAIEQDPLLGASYVLLADIHETAFELEEELAVLKEAIDRGIRAPGVYVRYGAFLERYGLHDLARKAYEDGMKIRPDDAACLMALADLEFDCGAHTAALDQCEEALRSPSLSADMKVDALLLMGRILLALDRLADASQEAGRAVNLDQENFTAWNLKGSAALAGGDTGGALEAFQRALEIDPQNADAVCNLGVTLLRQGEVDDALKRFAEAADLDPYFASRPLVAQGFAFDLTGETESALDSFGAAVKVEPDNAYALYMQGRFQRRQGDPEEATATLKRALRISGRNAAVLGELGHACLDAGRLDDAAFYFLEYTKQGAEDYKSLFLQGVTALRLDRVAEAEGFFKKAVDKNTKAPEPLNGLAVAYYRGAKYVEATDTFSRVMRLFPEDSLDPSYRFAFDTRAIVDAHLRKSQWVDRFQRKEIKNGWDVVQRFGPKVFIVQNEIRFNGMQRQGLGDEMSQLRREISGKEFRLLEAEIEVGDGHQGTAGIFLGSYIRRSAQGAQANAEIRLGVNHQGKLLYRLHDQNRLIEDWREIEGYDVALDEPIKLGIEISDYENGRVTLLLNETPVVDELIVKKLKKISRNVNFGLFGQAKGGRTIDFKTRFARIVKTEPE